MRKIKILQEIRTMQFEEIYKLRTKRRLSVEEAAELLGIRERTFRRWCRRYEEEGAEGLYDHRLDRIANNAAPVDEVMELLSLFETSYADFNISHFYDKYKYEHKGERSYSWVKDQLQKKAFLNGLRHRMRISYAFRICAPRNMT